MLKIRWSIGVVLAFFVGLMTAAILSGAHLPMAIAQEATKPSLAPRFQVSAWAYPATLNGSNSDQRQLASFGAYIVDTQTGKVWHSEGQSGGLRLVGQCK
jgi:hypothetical protein